MNKKSILYSAGILTMANAAIRIAGFGYRVWLTRSIGAEAMGIYQMAVPCIGLALTAVASGLPIAFTRAVAMDKAKAHAITKAGLYIEALLSGALCILLIAISPLIGFVYKDSQVILPTILLAPSVLFIGMRNAFEGYFIGLGNTVPSARCEMCDQASRIIITVILIKLLAPLPSHFSACMVAATTSIGELVSFSVMLASYRKQRKKAVKAPIKPIITEALPTTGGRLLTSLLQTVSSLMIPRLLLASGLTQAAATQEFGIVFGMALPIMFLPSTLFSGLTTVLIPSLSESNQEQAKQQISRALQPSAVASFGLAAIMTACAQPLGTLLFHQPKAGAYLSLISPLSALTGVFLVSTAILFGLGLQKKALINQITSSAMMLLLCLILIRIPQLRLNGYILAFGADITLNTLLNLRTCARFTHEKMKLGQRILQPLLCGALAVEATMLLLHTVKFSTLLSETLVSAGLCCLLFLVTAGMTGLLSPTLAFLRQRRIDRARRTAYNKPQQNL